MSVRERIPEEVIGIIEREARRRGLSLAEFLVNSVANELDPTARLKVYVKLHEKLLKEAEELSGKGDLVQASEKYWGAVTSLLNAIGEEEDLPHYTHKDLKEVSIYLSEKEGDPEYTRLFSSVETLHSNYYHAFLKEATFKAHVEDAQKLIEKLRRHLRGRLGEAGRSGSSSTGGH
jgi:hypothetical protein